MSPLPTILLIPGAFTEPTCYDFLVPHLENAGHPVVRAPLITCNPQTQDPKTCTAEQQGLDLLEKHLRPLIEEQEKEVLVFAHSFGATTCSGAGSRLTKEERLEDGKQGGVLGIVYISFAFCKDGMSQLGFMGLDSWPPFCRIDYPSPGLFVFEPAVDMLWDDLDSDLQEKLKPTHLPHAYSAFETPVKKPLWTDPALDGKRVYVLPKQDKTFPPEAQRMFVESSGVDWDVKEVDAGHAAFIGKAEEVAGIIVWRLRRRGSERTFRS